MDDMEETKSDKSVVLLHEYTDRDVYDTHHLRVIDDAQLMTKIVIDYALLECFKPCRMSNLYADSVLRRYEILSGILAATFLIKYCSLLASDLDC